MNIQENKIAISLFLGAAVIAGAVYFGLTKLRPSIPQPKTGEPMMEASPTIETSPTIQQPTDKPPTQETPATAPSPVASPIPEISWTKSDLIAALSSKTGIPEAEIVFSTGDIVDHGNTKLIRGTVQRQGEMGGAGFFAVADVDGVTVTYAGQGVPDCSEVNPYNYPLSWADYCMDGGNTVRR